MNRKSLVIFFSVFLVFVIFPLTVCNAGSLGINVTDPQYPIDVSSSGQMASQLHFSLNGSDVGGWLTSVQDNNFWISSGALFDSSQGGWIQKSPDGKSIFAGSGAAGFRIYAQQGAPVGGIVSAAQRFIIDYNGFAGFGVSTPSYPIHLTSGARCTTGGVWTNASSREYKDNIKELSSDQALLAFNKLNPVTFNYKADSTEKHVGFIAEDVPDLVATPDRKALSTMDIVAVLTKVMQEQNKIVQEQQKTIAELNEKVSRLELQGK